MVVNRSDTKKRRKEGDNMDHSVEGSPKRTKVHAQRKFAQGSSSVSSIALTPVKDKDKLKTNGAILSSELIPLKRPKTEDFLTFLCFRGSPILPPSLNFFNVATFQDPQDDDSCVPVRDGSPNSSVDFTSVGQKLQQVLDIDQASEVCKSDEKSLNEAPKRRTNAVQAIRKKYQEQRLAKQRANTLNNLAQKVHGKTTVLTRSSALREQSRLGLGLFQTKKHVIKKCPEKVVKVSKPSETVKFVPLTKGPTVPGRTKVQSSESPTTRRCGLRSGSVFPFKKEKSVDHVIKEHTIAPQVLLENDSKAFVSSLSDFSSDDDQPLAKTRSEEQTNQKEQLAKKVMKRITNRSSKIHTRMLTRSRIQEQQDQHLRHPQKLLQEVSFQQKQSDKHILHHHIHYLYRRRRIESEVKQPVHVQLKRTHSLPSQHQRVPHQIATRY